MWENQMTVNSSNHFTVVFMQELECHLALPNPNNLLLLQQKARQTFANKFRALIRHTNANIVILELVFTRKHHLRGSCNPLGPTKIKEVCVLTPCFLCDYPQWWAHKAGFSIKY